jgi:hypothetical protein
MTTFWTQMREGMATGYQDPHFWDTALALGIVIAQLGFFAYLTWRDRSRGGPAGHAPVADRLTADGVAAGRPAPAALEGAPA